MGSVCCLDKNIKVHSLIYLLPGHICLGLVAGGQAPGTDVSVWIARTRMALPEAAHLEIILQCLGPQGLSVFLGSA